MRPIREHGVARYARLTEPRLSLLRRWRLPLLLTAVLTTLQTAGLRGYLEYERAAVLHGELWRLLTGNFVHLGWAHLLRDVAGLILIWALFEGWLAERTWVYVLAGSSLAAGVGLLAFSPAISWYVGISGVLFGMFSAGALAVSSKRPLYAGCLLIGMIAVIAWTLYAGALPGETAGLGGKVVPQAHLYGAVGGVLSILIHGDIRTQDAATAGVPKV